MQKKEWEIESQKLEFVQKKEFLRLWWWYKIGDLCLVCYHLCFDSHSRRNLKNKDEGMLIITAVLFIILKKMNEYNFQFC